MLYCALVVIGLLIILGILIWWFVVLSTNNSGTPEVKFTVNLSGDQVVPPIETDSFGNGQAILSDDRTGLTYNVFINGLNDQIVSDAQFRLGASGENGEVLKNLSFNQLGPQAQIAGRWTTDDVEPLNSNALLENNVYLLIKTEDNPDGYIRGQMLVATE